MSHGDLKIDAETVLGILLRSPRSANNGIWLDVVGSGEVILELVLHGN